MAAGGGIVGSLEALKTALWELDADLTRMRRQIAVLDQQGMLEALLAENHAAAVGHLATARQLAGDLHDLARVTAGAQRLHEPARRRLRVVSPRHSKEEDNGG